MAELRVTRADLTAQARMNKEGSEISLSDLDRQRSAVRDIEDVVFIDDDGTEYQIKGENNSDLDYLKRKEDNTSHGDDTRDGVLGTELQHRNTTGGEGGDLTTDEANLKDAPGTENQPSDFEGEDQPSKPTTADDLGGHGMGGESANPSDEEVARLRAEAGGSSDEEQTTSGEAPEDQTIADQETEQPSGQQTDQEQPQS